MGRRHRSPREAVLALALALLASGCCVNPADPPPPFDPCARGCSDGGAGVPLDGAPLPPLALCAQPEFGAPCEHTCTSAGLTCFRERRASTSVPLEGDDGGVATLEAIAFPDGLCSIPCASDGDCGDCARCVPYALAGRARLRGLVGSGGVCRPRCTHASGCPAGTACDGETRACLEACTSDEQCRFVTVDSNGDGIEDALSYRIESALACIEGRCTDDAPALSRTCTHDIDCEPGFGCLRSERSLTGLCGRLGCVEGSCGEGATCVERGDGARLCTWTCEIGAHLEGERIGSAGRAADCDQGFACVWTGSGDPPIGACMPGEYNDVLEPNVGATCAGDVHCYSPYGRGHCLRARPDEPLGACVVHDCVPGGAGLMPGVPVLEPPVICDTTGGAICLDVAEGRERTMCVVPCETADDCLFGWACVALPGGDARACFPDCTADADCRPGTSCKAPGGLAPCSESERGCACQ